MAKTDQATAKAEKKSGKMTGRLPQLLLMGGALFGLLCWLVLLGGVCAITDTTDEAIAIRTITTGLLWVVTLMFLFWLITLFLLAGIGMKKVAVLRRAKTGLLWFLAVIAAWMGVQAHRLAQDIDAYEGRADILNYRDGEGNLQTGDNVVSRYKAALAGIILCLISIFIMAIMLSLVADNHDMVDKITKAGAKGRNNEAAGQADAGHAHHGHHDVHAPAPMAMHASQVPVAPGVGNFVQTGSGVPVNTGAGVPVGTAPGGVHTGTGQVVNNSLADHPNQQMVPGQAQTQQGGNVRVTPL